jgi:protein O-GlcNAc transferase
MMKVERNDPCPCGSGKKYKHCCLRKQTAPVRRLSPEEAFIPMRLQMATDHFANGRLSQAVSAFQQILLIKPNHAEALHRMGLIAYQQGDSAKAVALLGQAIEAKPSEPSYYVNLGNILLAQGRFAEAVERYQQVLAIRPAHAKAHANLGVVLRSLGQLDEAVTSYRKALAIEPGNAETHSNMANTLRDLGRLSEAISSYQDALTINPNFADAHNNLGNSLQIVGRQEEAIASYRRALAVNPGYFDAHSNLLMAMQFSFAYSPAEAYQEHMHYAQCVQATLLEVPIAQHKNSPDSGRRLKVGYVSGDFRRHAVAFFIEPILANHDKSMVEAYCYYNHSQHDSHTDKFIALADHWLPCKGMGDEQLANRIRADGIDILVDLSGHSAHNRLPMFARKPAPVQVTWIGYAGTTGLTAMDYRITDVYMDPPGMTERFHSETLIRLPGSNITYRPEPGCPDVNELPALTSGKLVFASLNNLTKVNQSVVNLWSRILTALPQSTLMLGNVTEDAIAQRLIAMFASAGIGPERLQLQPRMTMLDYLKLHHQIDIALDPFPYNGGTTSMHSLWMGVPIITMAGEHAVSRVGVAVLSRVELTEFITNSEEQYFQCALAFAQNLPGLSQTRQSLRERMSGKVCSPSDTTRSLEAAYREMWQSYVAVNRSTE